MKNISFLLLISILFAACSSNKKQPVIDSVLTHSSIDAQTAEIIKRFGPFVQGVWVASGYIDTLSRTRSPIQSDKELGGVAAFAISLPDSKSDSIHVGYSLGNHEGANFVLYFKTGQRPNSLKTNLTDWDGKGGFFELGYVVTHNDTALVIYHYNKTAIKLDSTKYTKVADKPADENDAAWGIQYITNKKLITGEYLMSDSTGSTRKATFNDHGKVTGFPGFENYYVNTDFSVEPGTNPDELIFDLYSRHQKLYAFKFNADTLNLFETKDKDDSVLIGKLKYKLVRQK